MHLNESQLKVVAAPLDVPVKVIAGAGTGKTQTLTERFLRIVGEYGVPPENILAITFTDKAANEMAARVRGILARSGKSVESPLNILTFHAFAGRILREHADEADISPDFTIIKDTQMLVLQRRLFRDATKGRLKFENLSVEDIAALDIPSLDDLREVVFSVISKAKGQRWTPEEWFLSATHQDDLFYDALPTQSAAAELGGKKGVLTNEIYSRLISKGFKTVSWDTAIDDDAEKKTRHIYFSNLVSFIPNPDADAQIAWERSQCIRLARVIRAFFIAYNAELAKRNALDYDDLILKAVTLLETKANVQRRYRERFRYVLVDEFQDTSPAQMQLIRAVARVSPCPTDCEKADCILRRHGRPENVTIVGDKKQAIYAWRNANRDNIDVMIPCPQSDVGYPLMDNYRSGQAIIGLANLIGSNVEPDDPELVPVSNDFGLIHVAAPFTDGKVKKNRSREARYIAERIQLHAQTTPYHDIAVLIRRSSQFPALREAFRDRNIPYVCEGAIGLFDEPCAKDIMACICLAVNHTDDASWYRLLSRQPVALTDRELADMRPRMWVDSGYSRPPFAESARAATAKESVRALAGRVEAIRSAKTTMSLVEFISALPVLSGMAEAWDPNDRAMWPQVLATLSAIAVEVEDLFPAAAVDDFLDLLAIYLEDDKSMPYVAQTETGVHVMTIHKAKGLEFPVVFVPSIKSSRKSEPGTIWDDEWGLLPRFATAEPIKKTIANWLRKKKELQEDEEERCWYVAATRAKRELVVTVSQNGKGKAPLWPIGIGENDVSPFNPADWESVVTVRDRGKPPEIEIPETRHALSMGTLRASFTTLKGFLFCPVSAFIDRVWRLPYFAEGTGEARMNAIRAGDIFHAAALRYHGANPHRLPDSLFERGDSQLVRQGVKDRWNRFLKSPCAQWTGVTAERRIRMRCQTASGPVTFNGFIDAMINEPDGWRLVDYKTGHLDDKSIADYALQLCLYRKALAAEGLTVLNEGWLAHVEPGSFTLIPVMLDEHESRLDRLIEDFVSMFARKTMPASPDDAPCEYCRHRAICPRQRDTPAP